MEIECIFDDYTKKYICTVWGGDFSEPGKRIAKFIGTHSKGKDELDVSQIMFFGIKVEYFPRGLDRHFPNLRSVNVFNCGLKQISKRDLRGLENLSELHFGLNHLTTLPDDLFTGMKRLTDVHFGSNKIEFASSKLLRPFIGRPDLYINLTGNTKINAFLHPTLEGSVDSLEALMKLIDEKCLKPERSAVDQNEERNGEISYDDLWMSGLFSDLNVVSGSRTFKAHKTVLAMKSSVFATTFKNNPEVTELKISVFSESAVNAMLSFIYTGEIPDDANVFESYSIAVKFKVEDMIAAYEDLLWDQLDDSNAWEIFNFAHLHSNNNFKAKVFCFISNSFPQQLPEKLMEKPDQLKEFIDARSEKMKSCEQTKEK